MKVSVFEKLKDSSTKSDVELSEILENIKSGRSGWLCGQIRSYAEMRAKNTDEKIQKEFEQKQRSHKEQLPCIIFQGIFSKRSKDGLIHHSGLATLDFDHVTDPEATRDYYFNEYNYVHAAFISPSGDGVKLLVRIPEVSNDAEYKEYYNALLYYFENAADKQTSDISRICFESYDKDLKVRDFDLCNVFRKKITEIKQYEEVNTSFKVPETNNRILDIAAKMINDSIDGEKHRTLLKASRLLGGYVAGGIIGEQLAIDTLETCIQNKNINSFTEAQKTIKKSLEFGKRTPIFEYKPYKKTQLGTQVVVKKSHTVESETEPDKPKFPMDVFPEVIQVHFDDLNKSLNYSNDFMAAAFIFSIATMNGNSTKLRVKNGWIAPTIFWLAAVGEPGTMKTHPVKHIIEPLKKIDAINKDCFDSQIAEWEMIPDNKGKRPIYKQLIVSDYTLEALHDVHTYNRRGLGLYKDELVAFILDMNKYRSGSDEQFWLESFNNSDYIINRVTKDPKSIDSVCINLIGTIQPQVLTEITKKSNGNGLIDRFLFTAAETDIFPMNKREASQENILGYINDMIQFEAQHCFYNGRDPKIMEMTPEAFDKMIQFDAELVRMQKSDSETSEIKNYLSKIKTYIPRFALVLRLIENYFGEEFSERVNVTDMDRAWKLSKYFINSAKLVFSAAETKEEIRNVQSSVKLKTKKDQVIFLYEQGFSNKLIAAQLKMAASNVSKYIIEHKKQKNV